MPPTIILVCTLLFTTALGAIITLSSMITGPCITTRTYIDIITYPRTFLIRTLPHNRHIVTYFTILTNDNFGIYQYSYASMVEKAPSPN